MHYTITLFASTYNCGSYGAGTYNSNGSECAPGATTASAASAASASSGADGLANTGQSVLLPISGGVLMIAVAIAILIQTLRRKK